MINLIILFLAYAIYKSFVLITFGYYTFRHTDRPDCYASSSGDNMPLSKRVDGDSINVTL